MILQRIKRGGEIQMKNNKGISLLKLILIVAILIVALFLIISQTSLNQKKDYIKEINQAAATYNLDIIKKNTIINKYYKNVPDDLLFKEVKQIPLDTANSKNYDTLIDAYMKEHNAVMEYNDTLLEYYREILQ